MLLMFLLNVTVPILIFPVTNNWHFLKSFVALNGCYLNRAFTSFVVYTLGSISIIDGLDRCCCGGAFAIFSSTFMSGVLG